MPLEASAYRYLIERLQPSASAAAPDLPFVFLKGPVAAGPESRGALLDFLASVAGGRVARTPPIIGFDGDDANIFSTLFRQFLDDVTRVSADPGLVGDRERRRNTELLRLLVDASQPQTVRIADPADAISLAFLIFFLEACMHFGWCPNTLECQAKRSAHILFNALKKACLAQDDSALAAVLCWLWGAWITAQKTEGVAERPFEQESAPIWRDYQWNIEDTVHSFSLFNTPSGCMGILEKSPGKMQPFQRLAAQTAVGMVLEIGEIPAARWTLQENLKIGQKRAFGCRCVWRGSGNHSLEIVWSTAVMIFADTVYRIDHLQAAPGAIMVPVSACLTLETPGPLVPASGGFEARASGEGFRLELVENPLGLSPDLSPQAPFTRVALKSAVTDIPGAAQSVLAWKRGKNVDAIDRTNLLGIHDLSPEGPS